MVKMKKKLFVLFLGLLVFLNAIAQTKPNVIFIIVDDLGYNDVGFMGSKYYETPFLDNLSSKSTIFSRAYAACQVCSPSRASILSGSYPSNHGVTDWIGASSGTEWRKQNKFTKVLPPQYSKQLDLEFTTIPELLKQNNYATFFAGKWHLGNKGFYPTDQGFDINIAGSHKGHPSSYFSPYGMENITNGPNGENLDMRLAIETSKFIEKNKDQPFFAFLSFYAVHSPIQTTKEKWTYFRDKSEKQGINENGFAMERILPVRIKQDNPIYAGLVSSMDDAVGVVLEALKKNNLDKNTIIIFTSDNGGVVSGDNFSSNLSPLRGGKGYQWEGGIRVPMFIYMPGGKAQKINTPVIGMDFLPTILELTNTKAKPSQKVDGVSLLPLLNQKKISKRPLFWHYPHYGNQGGEPSSIIQMENFKLIHYWEDGRNELYDLDKDLGEQNNIAKKHQTKEKEMWNNLNNWLQETNAKLPEIDKEYIAEKEEIHKNKVKTEVWANQEKNRKNMLKKDFQPNINWWGSQID